MATAGTGEEGRKKLTIAFIGAKGVGKTSIITQFVHNHFKEAVVSTSSPHRYSTTVVTNNNRIIEFHISDFPVLSKFPEDSLQEWNLQCSQRNKHTVDVGSSSTSNAAAGTTTGTCIPPQSFCRLRQVSAYVLVFDASRPAVTFQYIRQIREQILRNGGNEAYKRPIVVAVNKQDLVVQHQRPAIVGNSGSRSHRLNGGNQSSNTKNNPAWPTNEWSCLVRKQWRCLYVETSAKFNWQVVHLFQQVLSAVENCNSSGGTGRHPGSGEHSRLQHQIIQLPHILHLASLNAVVPIPTPNLLAQTMGPPPPPPLPPGTRNRHSTSPTRIRSRALRQCPVS